MKMDKEQQRVLYYSLDQQVTLGQLKTLSDFSYDEVKIHQLLTRMKQYVVVGISQAMSEYPRRCFQISHSPYLLYAMGNLELLQRPILGVVGPRAMSTYAGQVMEALFEVAKAYDVVTISGLARGVDQKCHQLSLKSSLPTIAVLGGGLRHYLQRSDGRLIREIVEQGGLVLSEFKLDFEPTRWSFPQRNKIIAGLSDCLFVPEAREGSGSLITVNYALQMKKEVFVAPNQLFSPNGLGTNQLLSQGKVKLLTDFTQILERFGRKNFEDEITTGLPRRSTMFHCPINRDQVSQGQQISEEEKNLLQRVKKYHNQELSLWSSKIGKEFGELLSQLTLLEMKGVLEQSSPGCYAVK